MMSDRYTTGLWRAMVFDPLSLTAAVGLTASQVAGLSAGATLAGGAVSGLSALMGGRAAKTAGQLQQQADEFKANQAGQNAGMAIGAASVRAQDTQQKTALAESTSTARAAGSGVDAGTGSAVENVGDIAKRGSYLAQMDLYNGESQATGLLNEAKGYRYSGDIAALEGEERQKASYLAAGGDLLSSAGSALKIYGNPRPSS